MKREDINHFRELQVKLNDLRFKIGNIEKLVASKASGIYAMENNILHSMHSGVYIDDLELAQMVLDKSRLKYNEEINSIIWEIEQL